MLPCCAFRLASHTLFLPTPARRSLHWSHRCPCARAKTCDSRNAMLPLKTRGMHWTIIRKREGDREIQMIHLPCFTIAAVHVAPEASRIALAWGRTVADNIVTCFLLFTTFCALQTGIRSPHCCEDAHKIYRLKAFRICSPLGCQVHMALQRAVLSTVGGPQVLFGPLRAVQVRDILI